MPADTEPLTFGLALPNYRPGATAEGIAAAAETTARLGWESVWTTDHLLADHTPAHADYTNLFEALTVLAWLAPQQPTLRLGTSVIVVPPRNAVILAKEVASLDALSGGRLTLGIGIGWSREEFARVGEEERFRVRGSYTEEAVALWRHLWSGSEEPFHGRFHRFEDQVFSPLPVQGESLPIWMGGRAEPALERAGRIADGYQASSPTPEQAAERALLVLAAAAAAGRPAPVLSARLRASFDPEAGPGWLLKGTPEAMLADLERFVTAGYRHFVIDFVVTDPEQHTQTFERFHHEVASGRMASPR